MDIYFYLDYYSKWLNSHFAGYPFVIRLTVFLVTIVGIAYGIFMIRFLITHRAKRRFDRTIKTYKEQLDQDLEPFLYTDINFKESETQELFGDSKRLVRRNFERRAFTQYIVDYTQDREADGYRINLNNYITLLDTFGIIDYWNKRLEARGTGKRHEAIRALDELNIGLTGTAIHRSTYHKNHNLRKNARTILMKYDINNPYRFLEKGFDTSFNAMDELRLHYLLSEKALRSAVPPLIRWIHTKNPRYRSFLVREIAHFNQTDSCPALLDLLQKESSTRVQVALVKALGDMRYEPALKVFKDLYYNFSSPVQKAIIEVLPKFQKQQSQDFLVDLYKQTFEHETKVRLAYAIGQSGPEGMEQLKKAIAHDSQFDQKVFEEVNFHMN